MADKQKDDDGEKAELNGVYALQVMTEIRMGSSLSYTPDRNWTHCTLFRPYIRNRIRWHT